MIAELYDSVAGTAVHVNSDYVVSVRPDPDDPLHQSIVKLKDGETVRWREYELKIHHLPGQTLFAMGLEVVIDGRRCLFTGDNFYHQEFANALVSNTVAAFKAASSVGPV